ncbi:MAG: NlpC/P60 family protein [Actinomycetota bacterium]|nr:NlpC/P60 family protein [Actinomycetota bacterium]
MSQSSFRARRRTPLIAAGALAALVLAGLGGAIPGAMAVDGDPSSPPTSEGGGSPGGSSDGSGSDGVGSSAPRPTETGGGQLPGQRPDQPRPANADPAPTLDPGFVDDYSVLWRKVQRGQHRIAVLSGNSRAARRVVEGSWQDLVATMRERGKAEAALAGAADQFSGSVRELYISGSTDVDIVLGVLGSEPDEMLRNIDNLMYLRSATGNESVDLAAAQQYAVVVESAHGAALIRSDADQEHATSVAKDLARAKRQLKDDQAELQALVAAAAPQTVVGKDGCPKAVLDGTVPADVDVRTLCKTAVKGAATAQAAVALKWALLRLGAPYACEGIGRLEAWRYDCSSYVSRAYAEGAGLGTAGDGWAPSTRDMVPWDGAALDPHYAPIPPKKLKPGDLVLYDTCPAGEVCPYRHVVMYLGPQEKGGVPMMAHTNGCGLVAHVEAFWGTDVPNFLGARRVMALPGEKLTVSLPKPGKPTGR